MEVDDHGYIPVDARLRTNVPHIYAVDVIGQPMLAHKAHEGHVAAEVIAGEDRTFRPSIPSIPAIRKWRGWEKRKKPKLRVWITKHPRSPGRRPVALWLQPRQLV